MSSPDQKRNEAAAPDPHQTQRQNPKSTKGGSKRKQQQGETHATQIPDPEKTGGQSERFSILRPHAVGGLGRVVVAYDWQLSREIALKEILPSHADDRVSRQRFLREAEITGALEHPGIVPVYSLGEFADGRPFYAMRFILGEDLRKAIEHLHRAKSKQLFEGLELRQLLGRFVDVCQAIDYSHHRGVVHRDIKPENIMLGDYGETLVVDWGLARPTDETPTLTKADESTATRSGRLSSRSNHPQSTRKVTPSPQSNPSHTREGQVVGTPAYMSPEQAVGRLDLLGPATDIYSLGATLYHLLVGSSPFDGSASDILAQVQRGQFPPPRERNPLVPKPLEAICLKAMAMRPDARYGSAAELALDIEHYLADEKVEAFDEPWPMRTWRWVRKHRTAVLSTMAAGTVALVALTVGVILLGAANQRERAAKDQATANFTESVKQRDRAEENFRLAREAVREYYIQVSEDTLLNEPGMQPLRDALLERSLDYFEQFLEQRQDDPSVRSELAQAAYYAGKIKELVESPAAAIPYFHQSLKHYEGISSESALSPELQADHARVLNSLGRAHQKQKQLDEAQEFYQRAKTEREQLAKANTDDPERARELASTIMNLAMISRLRGEPQEAIRQMEQAQALRMAHATGDRTPLNLQRDLARGYYNLATDQLRINEIEAAEANFISAADLFAKLIEREPRSLSHKHRFAIIQRLLAQIAGSSGKSSEAIRYYLKARDTLQRLVLQNPQVPDYAHDLAGVLLNLGDEQSRVTALPTAIETLQAAAEILQKLVDSENALPSHRRDLAVTERTIGELLLRLERVEEAQEHLKKSRERLQELVREFPAEAEYGELLRETMKLMAP